MVIMTPRLHRLLRASTGAFLFMFILIHMTVIIVIFCFIPEIYPSNTFYPIYPYYGLWFMGCKIRVDKGSNELQITEDPIFIVAREREIKKILENPTCKSLNAH